MKDLPAMADEGQVEFVVATSAQILGLAAAMITEQSELVEAFTMAMDRTPKSERFFDGPPSENDLRKYLIAACREAIEIMEGR